VINSRSLDLDPTGENGSARGSPWGLVFRRRFTGDARRGWISGELLVAPGRRQGYDEVQRESAMPRAWSMGLGIVSCDVCTQMEEF
jgi:hypothetical protein